MNDKRRAIYTHGYHESVLRSHRRRTAENSAGYLLPYLVPGLSVLDVGCGPGTITVDLAARVVPGSVTGVEPTDDALSLARAEAQLHRLSNISFTTSACISSTSLTTRSMSSTHTRCCSTSPIRYGHYRR